MFAATSTEKFAAVTSLITELFTIGPVTINNGGDNEVYQPDADVYDAADEAMASDECHIYFTDPSTGRGNMIYLVQDYEQPLAELVCDHSVSTLTETLVSKYFPDSE